MISAVCSDVIPAQVGIQIPTLRLNSTMELDSRVGGNDEAPWGQP